MNIVAVSGRLTREPEIRYGAQSQTAFMKFTLAVPRPKDKEGKAGVDYPSIVAFGKTAELVEKYCSKGSLVNVVGEIMTGSYEKDGKKTYTTDIRASKVEFVNTKKDETNAPADAPSDDDPITGFATLDEEIPF